MPLNDYGGNCHFKTGSVNLCSFLKLSQNLFPAGIHFCMICSGIQLSLILEILFVHYVLISSEDFLTKFTSKEVDKHNGNYMGVIDCLQLSKIACLTYCPGHGTALALEVLNCL